LTDTSAVSWVASDETLAELCTALDGATLVAADTEFVREKTYYPQLCLIQVATRELAACVDCLAPLDLAPLFDRLLRADCTWVLHSARQDLEVIWQRAERLPPRLIDTQIAAALIGWPPQLGLEGLLERTLKVTLGESYARTDWSRRPLPSAALHYALEDVRHLLPAWDALERKLAELGRLAWLHEDCARALAEPPVADETAVWARLKGVHGMPFPAQCAALELVRWRERAAQRSDRPRRWLLEDDKLLALAAAAPATPDEVGALMPPKFAARNGAEIVAAVARRDDAQVQALVRANAAQQAPDKTKVKELQEDARKRAAALGIEPEILATRRDLAALAAGRPPAHLRDGWRAAALGLGAGQAVAAR
jgi:ribonuclease D